ncbi:hypothetical protein GCM10009843_41730 [Nocardioides bigeumensis]|uniref:Uncharacterized protein n=1 Tax=Nocardioides bigeumensis TaxID=433657 RepID=A0ABP5KMR3_9ACTN
MGSRFGVSLTPRSTGAAVSAAGGEGGGGGAPGATTVTCRVDVDVLLDVLPAASVAVTVTAYVPAAVYTCAVGAPVAAEPPPGPRDAALVTVEEQSARGARNIPGLRSVEILEASRVRRHPVVRPDPQE